MVLTGLVAAFHKAMPLLRLKGRFIQVSLNLVYFSEKDLQKKVMLFPEARRDLLWMTQLQLSHCHGHLWPLTPEDCAIEVQTPLTKVSASGSGVTSTARGGTASTFGDISMPGREYFNVTLCF
jgi:hypothetical protein